MTKGKIQDYGSAERRRFERINIAFSKQVLVLDENDAIVGFLRQLGRGGFLIQPEKLFARDSKIHKFIIHEPLEDMKVRVNARVRYADPRGAGFEFVDLDADTAIEVGIIIGKYYESQSTQL
jgi:hypothetical protein